MNQEIPTYPTDMFCFALYRAHFAVHRAYAPYLGKLDLTYPQYIALTFLWAKDGVTVGHLSDLLGMTTGTVTPLLKRLEQRGFISRKRGLQDERRVMIHLTEKGRAVQAEAPDITRCMIEGTGLPIGELESLVKSLARLSGNLDAAESSVPAGVSNG